MVSRIGFFRALGLALVAALVPACHDSKSVSSGGSTTPPAVPVNLAPLFQGVKSAATAGGATVLLSWTAASDDSDAPSAIRYQVFSSASPGAQNFASPILTTAGGATSAAVTGTAGVVAFYVVRAIDSAGAVDTNTVEAVAWPLAAAQLVFVDDSAAGPGTGTFADPFVSLQDGVDAAEALGAGGIVLVAAGTYNEQVRLTVNDTQPLQILGGFPNWATFGATQPSAATMLAARDSAANLTVVDGTGITQFGGGEGLVHVENSQRPTFLSGLRVSEADAVAILGIDVVLTISDCSVRDPAAGNVTEVAIKLETSDATVDNEAWITGNDLRDFDTGAQVGRGVGVEFGGTTARMVISSNFIGHSQATTTSTVGISVNTSLFAVTDAECVVVPSGVTCRILIEGNSIFRTNDDGVRLDFEPEAAAASGSLDIVIRGNRIEFIDSDDAVDVDDLGFFGDGGTASLVVENNELTSHSSDGVEVDILETQPLASFADGAVTVVVRNNRISLSDDGYGEFDDLVPAAGTTLSVTFEGNQCVNPESTAFESDTFGIGAAGPLDGRVVFVMRNNDISGASNGDSPEFDQSAPPGPNGLSSITIEGEFHLAMDGTPDMDIDVDQAMGTDPAGTVYNLEIILRNNTQIDNGGNTGATVEVDTMVSNGTSVLTVTGNYMLADGRYDLALNDLGNVAGPVGAATVVVSENDIFSLDDDAIILDVDVTGGGVTTVDVSNNRILSDSRGLSVEVFSGSSAGGRAYTTIFNNRIESAESSEQLEYEEFLDPANSEYGVALILNNTIGSGIESSGIRLRLDEHSTALYARNALGPGEVDSNDGIVITADGTNPGNLTLRNNIVAYAPGDGVDIQGAIPAQFLNNTIAFNGMGGSTGDRGINSGGALFSPAYVKNSVVYRNGGGDLDDSPFLASVFSLVGDRAATVGFGNITADPLFLQSGDLRDLATNFQLRLGSPARDAGDPAATDNDPNGSRNDMGAYGGPYAGAIGSSLPSVQEDMPTTFSSAPLLVVGLLRPLGAAPTAPGQVDLYAGSLLQDFGPANPVNLVFSRPVNAASLGAVAFSVGGVPVAGAFTTSDGGRVATFTPTAPVAAGSVVTVAAGTGLQAATGGGVLAVAYRNVFGVLPAAVAETEVAGPDSNGTAATAEAIAGTPAVLRLDGTMFDQTDPADFYSFTAAAGQRFQISLAGERIGTPSASADFTLAVFDATGTTQLHGGDGAFGPVAGASSDPFVDFTAPAAGTYTIRVTAAMAAGGPYAYQLHWLRQ